MEDNTEEKRVIRGTNLPACESKFATTTNVASYTAASSGKQGNHACSEFTPKYDATFIKWLIILIALIVIATVTAVLVFVYCPEEKENTTQPQEIAVRTAPRMVITDTPYVSKSYTINATVLPTDADNKRLTWDAAFENPNSGWANGKNIAEYIKLTPSADTSSCSVECLKAFGETVIVTVTSEMSPEVKTTCRCGYLQQSGTIGSCWISFGESMLDFNMSRATNTWESGVLGYIYDPYSSGNMMSASELCFSCEITSNGTSTVQDSFEYTYTFEATEALKSKMREKGYSYSKVTGMLDNGSIVTDIPNNFAFGCYFPLMGMDGLAENVSNMDFIMEIDTVIYEALNSMGNTPFMTLTITATGSKATYTQTTSFVRG